jgi:hypothetical protein
MPHSFYWADKLICSEHCITTDELCRALYILKGTVMAIVEQLGYSKVCALWVPWMLTGAYKETKIFCTNLALAMRYSWCIFAWGMKPGLTIQNPNPSGI